MALSRAITVATGDGHYLEFKSKKMSAPPTTTCNMFDYRYHALCTMPVRSAHCFYILWPVRPISPVCSAHLTAEVLPLWSTSVFRVESTHSAWTLRSIRWYSLIFAGNLQSAATLDAYLESLEKCQEYSTLPETVWHICFPQYRYGLFSAYKIWTGDEFYKRFWS